MNPTPAQGKALRAMALNGGTLHRWPGGFWCTARRVGPEPVPKDYVATPTVNALVARRWAAPVDWMQGSGRYKAIEITQAGRDLAATLTPGARP